jgi:hypothetical protein
MRALKNETKENDLRMTVTKRTPTPQYPTSVINLLNSDPAESVKSEDAFQFPKIHLRAAAVVAAASNRRLVEVAKNTSAIRDSRVQFAAVVAGGCVGFVDTD